MSRDRETALEHHATAILRAADEAAQIEPASAISSLSLEDAYEISARIAALRQARAERPVGWKIGFTNRTIWDEYGVHAPIWGPMYDSTVTPADQGRAVIDPNRFCEPRIEPEIAFSFVRDAEPGMDEAALLACIDGVAHGFEIVQSVYPGWRFDAADTVAAFALHGAYRHGPFAPIAPSDRPEWLRRLADFEIALSCDGVEIDRGHARNVLDGPLSALRHFSDGLAAGRHGWAIRAGDIVTTGTVTRAHPVASGQSWTTRLIGLPLDGLRLDVA